MSAPSGEPTLLAIGDSATGALLELRVVPAGADGTQDVPVGRQAVVVEADAVGDDPLAFLAAYYLSGGEALARAAQAPVASGASIVADGVDALTISNLENPCMVTIAGATTAGPLEVTDGELILTCDTPGTLRVRVDAGAAWLPWETTIEVGDAP